MNKKYKVKLLSQERGELGQMIATGKAAAYKLTHARILLKADASEDGPAWSDQQIAAALEVSLPTVQRVRQRFVEQGLEAALERKKTPRRYVPVLDGAAEAHLVALACSQPPAGRNRWTIRLLSEQMVELEYVVAVGRETVRRTLKKTNLSPG